MSDAALLAGRVGLAALLLAFHGTTRLGRAADYLAGREAWPFVELVAALGFPWPAGFAVASAAAESIGAVLLASGAWTRLAAGAIAINMLVATYNEVVKGDSLELPALYLAGAVMFVIAGGGRWSVDAMHRRRHD